MKYQNVTKGIALKSDNSTVYENPLKLCMLLCALKLHVHGEVTLTKACWIGNLSTVSFAHTHLAECNRGLRLEELGLPHIHVLVARKSLSKQFYIYMYLPWGQNLRNYAAVHCRTSS
jgi:hypothetical protein